MKTAIVTGAARGIGAFICTALLENGYKVCAADINEPTGTAFVAEQQKLFGEGSIFFSRCNVSKEEDFKRTFEKAVNVFQNVDLLVNNAGVGNEKFPKDIIDVNLMGTIIGCQLAFKHMGQSNGGQGGMVVNTSSLVGLVPYWKGPVYSATKHGIIGLTRCYGCPEHEKRDGVIFAALCPGLTDTPVLQIAETHEDYSERPDMMSPDYVAQGVMKLLEDRINGSTLVVTKSLGYRYIECQKEIDNIPIN